MSVSAKTQLLPREPLLPDRWRRQLKRAQLTLVLVLAAVYIVFFTWMFWWRFAAYEDFLLARSACPLGSHPQVVVEERSVPQPRTTQQFTLTSTYVECVLAPRLPPVVP